MKTISLTRVENGSEVTFEALIPDRLKVVMDHASEAGRGQFAFIELHTSGVSNPKCESPRISDKWVCVRPRYDLYLERKRKAVEAMTFDDVLPLPQHLLDKAKLEGTESYRPLFDTAREELLASVEKSESGRDTRTGYGHYNGVTVHLRTGKDGKNTILLADPKSGLPVVDSVMLYWYPISERVHDEGKFKSTDSHAKTRMKNHIEGLAMARQWRCISLGQDNFAAVHINGKALLGKVNDLLSAASDAELARVFREISFVAMLGDLTPLEALQREVKQEAEQKA